VALIGTLVYEYEIASVQEYDVTVGAGAQIFAGPVQTAGSDHTGAAGSDQTAAGSDQAGADSHWRACTSGQAVASCRGVGVMIDVTITVTLVGSVVERIAGAAVAVDARRSARAMIRNDIFEKDVERLEAAGANNFAKD
jgi:hypothetical protein